MAPIAVYAVKFEKGLNGPLAVPSRVAVGMLPGEAETLRPGDQATGLSDGTAQVVHPELPQFGCRRK